MMKPVTAWRLVFVVIIALWIVAFSAINAFAGSAELSEMGLREDKLKIALITMMADNHEIPDMKQIDGFMNELRATLREVIVKSKIDNSKC